MDPMPISTRCNSCDEISSTAGKVATIFKNAAGLYSESAADFVTLSATCETFSEAIQAIRQWIIEGPEKQLLETSPWYQLTSILGRAEKVITRMQDEVKDMLRSRYESRSPLKADAGWLLESIQSCQDDVQRETDALRRVFQLLRILSITDMTAAEQANNSDSLQSRAKPETPKAIIGSMAEDAGSVATINTLDLLSPPYQLFDV